MNRPNPNTQPKRGGFGSAVKGVFKKALKSFGDFFDPTGENRPTLRDMNLDADQYVVKQKLGRSFFTRQLSPGTRRRRIEALSRAELDLAWDKGWIR